MAHTYFMAEDANCNMLSNIAQYGGRARYLGAIAAEHAQATRTKVAQIEKRAQAIAEEIVITLTDPRTQRSMAGMGAGEGAVYGTDGKGKGISR